MPFSIAGYLVGRVVGERQGITDDSVLNRLSLMGGLMGTTPMGVIMTTVLAQREAEDTAAPPVITTPPPVQVEVPDVTDISYNEAKRKLEALGLVADRRDLYSITTAKGSVIHQDPEPKAIVSQGATVTLSVSLGSELPASCPPPQQEDTATTTGVNVKKTAQPAGHRG